MKYCNYGWICYEDMYGKILNLKQVSELRLKHRTGRDHRVADRITAVLLYDMDWNYEQIAEALFT